MTLINPDYRPPYRDVLAMMALSMQEDANGLNELVPGMGDALYDHHIATILDKMWAQDPHFVRANKVSDWYGCVYEVVHRASGKVLATCTSTAQAENHAAECNGYLIAECTDCDCEVSVYLDAIVDGVLDSGDRLCLACLRKRNEPQALVATAGQ
jgi:hypothetical protein